VRIWRYRRPGGGIGAALIKRLKRGLSEEHEVIALGTNAVATAQMMKARANRGPAAKTPSSAPWPRPMSILGCLSMSWPTP